jgi:hypothetical protein
MGISPRHPLQPRGKITYRISRAVTPERSTGQERPGKYYPRVADVAQA